MQGNPDLQRLLDRLKGFSIVNNLVSQKFSLLAIEDVDGRAKLLRKVAKELKIDPEIVDNYDLAGIEEKNLGELANEAHARFLAERNASTPERQS